MTSAKPVSIVVAINQFDFVRAVGHEVYFVNQKVDQKEGSYNLSLSSLPWLPAVHGKTQGEHRIASRMCSAALLGAVPVRWEHFSVFLGLDGRRPVLV